MPERPPNQELETAPDFEPGVSSDVEPPEEGMRKTPTDPPAVVPTEAAEQPAIAAGMGLAGFAKANPEGGLTGDEDVAWERRLPVEDEER
ncbi:MAG: hypothetical protein M3253_08265 [Chloroflexota bacterium]|nr:hypothetical protein [Chloroflexota bacterium]